MDNMVFEQHDDPDVIIPDNTARPLVFTAHLLLANAILAICFGHTGLFIVLLFVYLTSIWHWSKPRFSSLARRVDYFAVFTAVFYGSFYLLYNLRNTLHYKYYCIVWFTGLGITTVIFVCNESSYYLQVMKLPSGSSMTNYSELDEIQLDLTNCYGYLAPTFPNTPEREFVYKRVVFVHLLCIHVFTNILACILILQLL